jgi:predicted DNA-binding transcriptional regulator AlpA
MIGDGRFPRPYRLSPRISVWKAVEIRRWLANQGLT